VPKRAQKLGQFRHIKRDFVHSVSLYKKECYQHLPSVYNIGTKDNLDND